MFGCCLHRQFIRIHGGFFFVQTIYTSTNYTSIKNGMELEWNQIEVLRETESNNMLEIGDDP